MPPSPRSDFGTVSVIPYVSKYSQNQFYDEGDQLGLTRTDPRKHTYIGNLRKESSAFDQISEERTLLARYRFCNKSYSARLKK